MSTKKDLNTRSDDLRPNLSPANIYLIAYNVLQFLGWLILLTKAVHHVFTNGFKTEGLWKETGLCLKIFQTLALLEIVHVIIGIVKSSVVTTAVQLFSRVFCVWGICNVAQASQGSVGLIFILIAWTVTEVIRYSFYFLNILKVAPSLLVYFRYTFFIILYPMGVLGEQLVIYAALPIVDKKKLFSITLPNDFNFTFSYYYFCLILMALYIPLFPKLYLHMFYQRKKVLGTPDEKKKN